MAKSPSSDEYRSLTGGRLVKTYGTTPKLASAEFSPSIKGYVEYQVQRTDTLENLAKKHSTTVTDLKRKNKLWNNETLLFRETILVPVHELPTTSTNSSNTPSTSEIPKLTNPPTTSNSSHSKNLQLPVSKRTESLDSSGSNRNSTDGVKCQQVSVEIDDNTSGNDFFAKFDKSFKTISKNVKTQIDRSEELLSADSEDVLYNSNDFTVHHKNNHRNKGKGKLKKSTDGGGSYSSSQSSLNQSSSEDIRHAPEPSFIKPTRPSKSTQRKLLQHEQRQNELFEL